MKRDTKNALIAGVCAGISRESGIDVIWIRLAFILGFVMAGLPILVYPLLWILMPKE